MRDEVESAHERVERRGRERGGLSDAVHQGIGRAGGRLSVQSVRRGGREGGAMLGGRWRLRDDRVNPRVAQGPSRFGWVNATYQPTTTKALSPRRLSVVPNTYIRVATSRLRALFELYCGYLYKYSKTCLIVFLPFVRRWFMSDLASKFLLHIVGW